MARKCAWLSGNKDHQPVGFGFTSSGAQVPRTPRGDALRDPRPAVPPHLEVWGLPTPPKLACAIAQGFVVKKKRGLGVEKDDPKWVAFPPENPWSHARDGRGRVAADPPA